MSRPPNPSAFPIVFANARMDDGMTLRDYFAAKWLTTVVIAPGASVSPDRIAQSCYQVADAMLAERIK